MKKVPGIILVALIILIALNFIVGTVPKPGEQDKRPQPTDIEFVDPKIIF